LSLQVADLQEVDEKLVSLKESLEVFKEDYVKVIRLPPSMPPSLPPISYSYVWTRSTSSILFLSIGTFKYFLCNNRMDIPNYFVFSAVVR